MKSKCSKETSKKYISSKRNVLLEKIISFLEITIAIFIVLIDNLWNLFKKPFKRQKASNIQKIEKISKEYKYFKIPILLKRRVAFACVAISFLLICGGIYALFTDQAVAEVNLQAGTVLVKLEEDEPFNNLSSIPEEGVEVRKKTFRAVSICSLDTYARARIIPIIEKYDEKEKCYVVIPIDVNDVTLDVYAKNWTYSNGYYYYNNILKANATSEDVVITITNISNSDDYKDTNIRITLHVELEAAQVRNDLWKTIFNIDILPI